MSFIKKMNKSLFDSIKNKYNLFRKNLEERITSSKFWLFNNECYLINKLWNDEFQEKINKFKELYSKNQKKEYYIQDIYPKISIEFINDISIAINYFKSNKIKLLVVK